MHLQSYALNVWRIAYMSSAQIHYLRLTLIKPRYQKISVNVSSPNFSKICARVSVMIHDKWIDERTWNPNTDFVFCFIKNIQKSDYCHILTLTLYEHKSWSMPQLPGVNFLTSHWNKFNFYACLLIYVYVRSNSFLWMKILISGLILYLEVNMVFLSVHNRNAI